MGVKGYIMQLQPFSVNDGDGIRTTVFMAGCPLRCRWCSNPEGFTAEPKIGWFESRCIGCGACEAVCPEGIGINMNEKNDADGASLRSRCTACGRCADVCPAESRSKMVSLTDADAVLRQIQKHRIFYSYSGGGVTFSGGEATMQTEFLDCLSEQIYDMGISMAIETCCMFDWDKAEHILRRMDLIFADIKMMDTERHRLWTGVPNEKILENIKRLGTLPQSVVVRIPVIAGVNDDDDNIRNTAAFVHENLPDAGMELLPYHELGKIKNEALGIPFDNSGLGIPDGDRMERLKAIVTDEGVRICDFR